MPAECELSHPGDKVCGVLAVGRCVECHRAFCPTHRLGSQRCSDHPVVFVERTPATERFPVNHADASAADYETRARDLFVTVAHRFLGGGGGCSVSEVRFQLGLGRRRPMWLPDGRYNTEPVDESEIEKDRFAWEIIKEGVQVGLFTTHDEEIDRVILFSEINSAAFQKYHELGIEVDQGPFDPFAPHGLRRDPKYYEELISTLKARRPSNIFVEAYRTYHQPGDDADRRLKTLPEAGYDMLVDYIKDGASQDPDQWSLEHGARLHAAYPWRTVASALADARVPFGPGGVVRRWKGMLGRHRSELIRGWVLDTVAREKWNGNYREVTRLLKRDGVVIAGNGEPDPHPGKPNPHRIRAVVHKNMGNESN